MDNNPRIQLKALSIYPVKSLRGIQVDHWPLDPTGLRYDRQWMLVDENNQFLSQRRLPRMALLKTSISDQALVLSDPDNNSISTPLLPPPADPLKVKIWHDQCHAHTISHDIDRWLSDFLDIRCRLVYLPEATVRQVDPDYSRNGDRTAFSDGFPLLLLSDASLQALNDAMSHPVTMSRFRPNLVVTGCPPYAEDCWRKIIINTIPFRLPKPCSRCSITTIDPDTGESGPEPLLTMSKLRRWKHQVYFGQNAIHDQCGILKTGDHIQILESGPAQPPL